MVDTEKWLVRSGYIFYVPIYRYHTSYYTHTSYNTYFSLSIGSKPTVGSSNIKSVGLWRRATARETLRCWPPLKNK